MKLYDKIGVPSENAPIPWVALHGPFIVLSIEELKELWNAGAQHGYESDFGGPAPDLTTYLQSKGINI